jgi:hypothetical protein
MTICPSHEQLTTECQFKVVRMSIEKDIDALSNNK